MKPRMFHWLCQMREKAMYDSEVPEALPLTVSTGREVPHSPEPPAVLVLRLPGASLLLLPRHERSRSREDESGAAGEAAGDEGEREENP